MDSNLSRNVKTADEIRPLVSQLQQRDQEIILSIMYRLLDTQQSETKDAESNTLSV